MTQHNHQTAPTQFVEANGIRFAYRRFGKAGGVPLVFNQHYLGTMDYWDPAVTDGLARDREVILFNNAGVSSISARCHHVRGDGRQRHRLHQGAWPEPKSMCSASRSAASSRRKSPCRRPIWFAG